MTEFSQGEINPGFKQYIDSTLRYRSALRDPAAYVDQYADSIHSRLEERLRPDSDNAVLIPVYNGKGLPWTIDQFSRQQGSDFRLIVFQNGHAKGSEKQEEIERMAAKLGVEYHLYEKGLGAWGARAHGLYHFEELFPGNHKPEFLWTYDEDTGPLSPRYAESIKQTFDANPKLGAIYSPAVFMTEGKPFEVAQLLAYKAATMTTHKLKTLAGGTHTVGSTAVFRRDALLRDMHHPIWDRVIEGNPDYLKEDDMLRMLLDNGYTARNTFSPTFWNLTAGDKLAHYGVHSYAYTIFRDMTTDEDAFDNMYRGNYVHNTKKDLTDDSSSSQ